MNSLHNEQHTSRNCCLSEIIIVLLMVLTLGSYLEFEKVILKADGVGYYDYLPSFFMHDDLNRKDHPIDEAPEVYERLNSLESYAFFHFKYVPIDKHLVNKYPVGVAILQMPFFCYAYYTNFKDSITGYEDHFQQSVFYASVFYVLLSLFFFRKLLEHYQVKKTGILLAQVLLVFSTPVLNYVGFDACFSHVYSLFAVTVFAYFTRAYFCTFKPKYFIGACVFLGLVFLIRQVNVLVVLAIPFLAGSWLQLKQGVLKITSNKKYLFTGAAISLAIVFMQPLLWYVQTGKFYLDAYPEENFDFTDPEIMSILFSYRKGLFIYTPVLILSLVALFWFFYQRKFYVPLLFACFLFLITYVFSSWWTWSYSASFGSRPYIEFLPLLFLPFVIMFNNGGVLLKVMVLTIGLSTLALNVIQTYQYKYFILHWDGMDKEAYWKVFLETDFRFRGLVFAQKEIEGDVIVEKEIQIGNVAVPNHTLKMFHSMESKDIPNFEKVNMIQMSVYDNYQKDNDTRMYITIKNEDKTVYWNERCLLHFQEKAFGEWQKGFYNFGFPPIPGIENKTILFHVKNENGNETLKNVAVKFLTVQK